MSQHLLPVLVVLVIVGFLLYQNINKITANIDDVKGGAFNFYMRYARIVENYIKNIENIVEKNSVLENEKYRLKENLEIDDVTDKLSSLIRKLAFFETVQAKEKNKKELEAEFFNILTELDTIVKESFIKGDELADEIREDLHQEYLRLKG